MSIKVNQISKTYDGIGVLENFSLTFESGGIHCLYGPSGCGKTTLLKVIAELLKPDKGNVFRTGKEKISFVFQEERLLPWYTVYENIDFVLKHLPYEERTVKIQGVLDLVKLWDFKTYKPDALSGGMKQRVALARAFAYEGNVLIMDEPFKGLDLSLKEELMDAVKAFYREHEMQVLLITHDLEEALYMASDIYCLEGPPLKTIAHLKISDFLGQESIRKRISEIYNK